MIVTIHRRVSMFRASDLGRVVAEVVKQYGPVTVAEEGTDWVLSAPAQFISADVLFGPTEAEQGKSASMRAMWARLRGEQSA